MEPTSHPIAIEPPCTCNPPMGLRSPGRHHLRWLPALLAAALATGSVNAQEPSPATFGETIDVDLVNVEIWVEDQRGEPVSGLTVEDFEILEDGDPVTVTHFREIRGGRPDGSTSLGILQGEDAGPTALEPIEEPGHLVLFFDELHLGPSSRKQLIADMRSFLAQGSVPAERVMIVRQGDTLLTEASFGSNREALDQALESLAEGSSLATSSAQEKRLALDRLQILWEQAKNTGSGTGVVQEFACELYLRRATLEVEQFANQERVRTLTTIEHLHTLSSLLAGVPGVKTLVYASDRLELRPGADLQAFIDSVCPSVDRLTIYRRRSEELSDEFRRFTRHANANRVTLHTIQATGLRPNATLGADQTATILEAPGFESARLATERDGLYFLATETGGRTILNRSRYDEVLEILSRDMSTYYSLAYTPPHGGDGKSHRIDVRLRGSKRRPELAKGQLQVRHRNGYRDKSADERMTEKLQSALYLGEVSNPLEARLGSGNLVAADKGWTLPLHVLVPVERIAFLPTAEHDRAQLELRIARRDLETQKLIVERQTFSTRRPPAGSSELLDLVYRLQLEEGIHILAVALRDEATEEASYLTTAVEIRGPRAATR